MSQAVQRTVEVSRVQDIDRVVGVPVIREQQVPTIQKVQQNGSRTTSKSHQ